MSDTICDNDLLLKHNVEVCKKCILLVIPTFFFKKSTFFHGFRIHFGFQTGTLEIVKNHFSQKRK